MAAQLMAAKGLSLRGLSSCTARANTSLPVPLSPSSIAVTFVGATFRQSAVFLFEVVKLIGALDNVAKFIGIDRLAIEIIGAEGDRFQRVFMVLVSGNDDQLRFRRELEYRLDGRKPLRRAVRIGRKAEIDGHDRRRLRAELRDRFLAVAGNRRFPERIRDFQMRRCRTRRPSMSGRV